MIIFLRKLWPIHNYGIKEFHSHYRNMSDKCPSLVLYFINQQFFQV